jgi:hypothetical protein
MEKTYYLTKEQFTAVDATWKSKKYHNATEHVIYNILRGKPADTGFSIKTKNIQGNDPWFGFNRHAINAKYRICQAFNPMSRNWQEAREAFKKEFGIDIPDDIAIKFDGLLK